MDASAPLSPQEVIDKLVRAAQLKGAFDYTQTILRVSGFETGDPFEDFRHQLGSPSAGYCDWLRSDEFLKFIWNLLQCSSGQRYNAFPFSGLEDSFSFDERARVSNKKVAAVVAHAYQQGWPEVADLVDAAYPAQAVHQCTHRSDESLPATTVSTLGSLNEALLRAFDRERASLGAMKGFYRWPRFEVLEILADDVVGLFGYRVYFSNGNFAEFTRRPEGTRAINLQFNSNGTPNYFVGSLDDLREEWRVRDKRLHEIGLPGKYNKLGEWKPLVYEGPYEDMLQEIREATSDPDVQGGLLYVYTTACWVVEFAVRANVDLPIENTVEFGAEDHPLRLSKLPTADDVYASERLYDGWITLAEPTVGAVELALSHIRVGMSRLAFAYDAKLVWRLKYSARPRLGSLACPTKEDLQRFDELLTTPVAPTLDLAIGWYNAGTSSSDPFPAFLCYFNAIEAVVEGVWEGEVKLPSGPLSKQTKAERLSWRRDCIQKTYEALFPHDPSRFAQEVYFNCLQQLAKRRRDVAEAVWGPTHEAITDLFVATDDDRSLTDIRNAVAHARTSVLDPGDVLLVESKLGRVAELAKALILRVLLKKTPGDRVTFWSQQYKMGMNMSDPRSTMICTTLEMLPTDDWAIRSEWIT